MSWSTETADLILAEGTVIYIHCPKCGGLVVMSYVCTDTGGDTDLKGMCWRCGLEIRLSSYTDPTITVWTR